jgi:DNA-binding NarL/FixJ family response regulator
MRNKDLVLSVALLASIGSFVAADIVEDYDAGLRFDHFAIHVVIIALAVTHGLVLWTRLRAQRHEARGLGRALEASRQETERWRREAATAIHSLGEAIDRQFARWELTEAEREVALLLIKGLSHKEIAALRDTSERTVRQQALAMYRKSGLGGRSQLAAFFLQDVLAPAPNARVPAISAV